MTLATDSPLDAFRWAFETAGYPGITVPEFDYIDAMGLDISKPDDLAWLHEQIVATGANFVVKDSLRRLTPSKAENESDDMAAAIAALAKLARDTGAAIILIHHKGDGERLGCASCRSRATSALISERTSSRPGAAAKTSCSAGRARMRSCVRR